MSTKIIFFTFFLFSIFNCFAQDLFEISGSIQDSIKNRPIASATIVLMEENEKIVKVGFSDEMGTFKLSGIQKGKYSLRVSLLGYATLTDTIDVLSSDVKMGILFMNEEAESLNEVVVTGKKDADFIKKMPGKIVIDLNNDLMSKNASINDILDNIPSVNADENGNVSIRGDNNVRFFLNGKPTQENLQTLATSQIEKIEIITSPSAKWDSDGTGIINIISKKTAFEGLTINTQANYAIGKLPKYGGSTTINYASGNFNLSGSVNLRKDDYYFRGLTQDLLNNIVQETENTTESTTSGFSLGVEYFLDKKNEMALNYQRNFYEPAGISEFLINDSVRSFHETDYYYNTHAIDYKYKNILSSKNHFIGIEAYFRWSPSETEKEQTFNLQDPTFTYNYEGSTNYKQFNIDYQNENSDKNSFSIGTQASFDKVDQLLENKNLQENFFSDFLLDFQFSRKIFAGYAEYKTQFHKFEINLGIRSEYVDREVRLNEKEFDYQYFKVYPSINTLYKITEKSVLHLDYSRRVVRPEHYQLTNIPKYFSPTSFAVRNPELKASNIDLIQFSVEQTFNKVNLNAALYYRNISDRISYVQQNDVDNPEIYIFTLQNTDNDYSYGFELISKIKFNKFYTLNANLDINSSKLTTVIDNENIVKNYTSYYIRVYNYFKVGKNNFQLNYRHKGNAVFPQGRRTPYGKFDLGYSRSLFKGKGRVTIRFTDPFDTYNPEYEIETQNSDRSGLFEPETRMMYVGLSYNFSKGNRKKFTPTSRMDIEQRDLNGVQF